MVDNPAVKHLLVYWTAQVLRKCGSNYMEICDKVDGFIKELHSGLNFQVSSLHSPP